MTEENINTIESAIQTHFNDFDLTIHRPRTLENHLMSGSIIVYADKHDAMDNTDGWIVRIDLKTMEIATISKEHYLSY